MNSSSIVPVFVGLALGAGFGIAAFTGVIHVPGLDSTGLVVAVDSGENETAERPTGEEEKNDYKQSDPSWLNSLPSWAKKVLPDFEAAETETIATKNKERSKIEKKLARMQAYLKEHPNDRKRAIIYGGVLAKEKKYEKAKEFYLNCLERFREDAEILFGIGWVCEQTRDWSEAVGYYERAAESNPKHYGVKNNLAWVLATAPDDGVRDGARAVELAREAARLMPRWSPFIDDTLAAAYAENGDFESAVKLQKRLLKKTSSSKHKELRERLELYKSGKPYREKSKQAREDQRQPAVSSVDSAA